jgi:hypothetical protein
LREGFGPPVFSPNKDFSMPVEKLTEAQAEAIRRDGVDRDSGITAQWGYHPKADARVFYLKDSRRHCPG